MKNEKPNLIDNSIEECHDHHSNEMQSIERCIILVIVLFIALIVSWCFIGFYKKEIQLMKGKIKYQDSVIISNQWKGAGDGE